MRADCSVWLFFFGLFWLSGSWYEAVSRDVWQEHLCMYSHTCIDTYTAYTQTVLCKDICTHTHTKKCVEHTVTAAGNVTCKDQMSDKEPCLCVSVCVSLASQGRGIKALQRLVAERKIATQWGWTHAIWLDYNFNISATNAEHSQ